MFVYQKDNRINVVLNGNLPSETPDMVFGEGVDGEATIVVGTDVVAGAGLTEEETSEDEEVEVPEEE